VIVGLNSVFVKGTGLCEVAAIKDQQYPFNFFLIRFKALSYRRAHAGLYFINKEITGYRKARYRIVEGVVPDF